MKTTQPNAPPPPSADERELGEITVESERVIEPSADVFDPRDQMLEPSDQLNRPSAELLKSEDEVTPCPAAPGRTP